MAASEPLSIQGRSCDTDEGSFLGVPWRSFVYAYVPIGLLSLPMLDHRSRDAVFGPYSWHYIVVLLLLFLAGASFAWTIARLVRRAPAELREKFALMIVMMPIGVIIAAEIYLGVRGEDAFRRYSEWGNGRSALMGFEVLPNHKWEMAEATYTTDGKRFRTHANPRSTSDDEFLVVTIGGSSVFGYGLNDDETWPHLLEEKLRKRFGDTVTVLNAGNNAQNTFQQMIRCYTRVLPEKPDLVIQYGATNDVRKNADALRYVPMDESIVYAFTDRDYQRHLNRNNGFYDRNSLLLGLGKRFVAKQMEKLKGPVLYPTVKEATQADYEEAREIYVRNVRTMRMMCEERGARFVAVTFLFHPTMEPARYRIAIPFLVNALMDDFAGSGYETIDIRDTLKDVPESDRLFFPDMYHPNRKGASFLAEQLDKSIAPIVAEMMSERLIGESG